MPTPPPAELAAQLVRADAALHAHVTVREALAEQLIELELSEPDFLFGFSGNSHWAHSGLGGLDESIIRS